MSLDLLVRSLIALGATRKDLARAIAAPTPPRRRESFRNLTYLATSRITGRDTLNRAVGGRQRRRVGWRKKHPFVSEVRPSHLQGFSPDAYAATDDFCRRARSTFCGNSMTKK